MILKITLVPLFLLSALSFSLPHEKIEKHSFKEYHNQEVEVRGYLKRSPNGEWFLSKESDLPSCCVGNISKSHQQIALAETQGMKVDEGRFVTLRGIFQILENVDKNGEPVEYFCLRSPREKRNNLLATTLFILIGFFFIFLIKISKERYVLWKKFFL